MIDLTKHKKILFVRLGKIGDLIITSSAIEALKLKYPKLEISLLTLAKNKEVLIYNSNIDNLFLTNKNITLYFKALKLRGHKYDLLIDLNDDPSSTSVILRKLIKAGYSAGFDFKENDKPDISVEQPSKNNSHIIERIKALFVKLDEGFEDIDFHPKIYLGEKERTEIFKQLKKEKGSSKVISLNISAGAPIRYWSVVNWINLLKRMIEDYPSLKFLILTTQKDKKIKERICESVDKKYLIPQNSYSFQHYASYICYSDILITPDTAAVHIASAFDVPVIALYPNYEWNFVSWQPLSKIYRSLQSKSEVIKDISVEEVYNSFKYILTEIEK